MYQTGESSEVKSVYCSFNGPELGSSHLHWAALNHQELQLQWNWHPCLVTMDTHILVCTHTHIQTNRKKSLKTYKILSCANYHCTTIQHYKNKATKPKNNHLSNSYISSDMKYIYFVVSPLAPFIRLFSSFNYILQLLLNSILISSLNPKNYPCVCEFD